jgi:hypothetical protein
MRVQQLVPLFEMPAHGMARPEVPVEVPMMVQVPAAQVPMKAQLPAAQMLGEVPMDLQVEVWKAHVKVPVKVRMEVPVPAAGQLCQIFVHSVQIFPRSCADLR